MLFERINPVDTIYTNVSVVNIKLDMYRGETDILCIYVRDVFSVKF